MNAMKWALGHTLHWAALYGAFFAGVAGAMYALTFWVWVLAPLSWLLPTDKVIAAAASKPAQPQPVRRWLNWTQAWATLGLLVWFGHLATGLAWLLVMAATALREDQVAARRSELAQATAEDSAAVPAAAHR